MKVIAFFNEKGGSAKTFFTVMFASFLHYKKGYRVRVFDADFPSYQLSAIRDRDLAYLSQVPYSPLAKMCTPNEGNFYPIDKCGGKLVLSNAEQTSVMRRIRSCSEDIVLVDFPGRFTESDLVHRMAVEGAIDMMVFPVDSDKQTKVAVLYALSNIQQKRKDTGLPPQKAVALYNRETRVERTSGSRWFADLCSTFSIVDLPFLKTHMPEILTARRESSAFGFIRNTLCWPQANINIRCPVIEEIFEEILGQLSVN